MSGLSSNITGYIKSLLGDDFLNNYVSYIERDFISYLRLTNTADSNKLINDLTRYGIELENITGMPYAYLVRTGNKEIGKTIEHATGLYFIQSLSSMLPPLVLDPQPGEKVLDLCAAPGSKSTAIAEMMQGTGTFYANEPNPNRIKSLVFNLDRMKYSNYGVLQQKGEFLHKHFTGYFDKVLVDAPCSALGILQKKDEVNKWWSSNHVDNISELQYKLLVSAFNMTKPGGEIVYSTCTLTVEENELILDKFLKKHSAELSDIELPVKSAGSVSNYAGNVINPEVEKARRIIPWEINSEGFFVSKLRKTDGDKFKTYIPPQHYFAKPKEINSVLEQISERFGISMKKLNNYSYILKGSDIFFINGDFEIPDVNVVQRTGSKFGMIDKQGRAYFHTNSARILSADINENIIELEEPEELERFLSGGTIKKEYPGYGQKVIKYLGNVLGIAVNSKGGLKSQFPRPMRTAEIIIK